MSKTKLACQTYTWQMSNDYVGRLDHILNLLGKTGFAGVESETQFLGKLADAATMKSALAENQIEFAALTLVEDWLAGEETPDERKRADECLDFLEHFPGTLLNLCQMPTTRLDDSGELLTRQKNLLACVHAIAERATQRGIVSAYHPNSPDESIYRTANDYSVLLAGLNDRLGWVPDIGHIERAGIDSLALLKDHRELVRHIHYKDMNKDGTWAEMGHGAIDFLAITRFLMDTGYSGWIVVEDEADRAIPHPDEVATDDWTWLEKNLLPIIS